MGDKKGKKDRAKEHRQTEARHEKVEKQKRDHQQAGMIANPQVRGISNAHQGGK